MNEAIYKEIKEKSGRDNNDGTTTIVLTNLSEIIVDTEIYPQIKDYFWIWSPRSNGVYRTALKSEGYTQKNKLILLKNVIFGPVPKGYCVRFKNGNNRDFRRDNLILTVKTRPYFGEVSLDS